MKTELLLCLFAQLIVVPCFAQSFTFHSVSPFGIQAVRGDSTRATLNLMFNDYDGDGDLDVFHTGLDFLGDIDTFDWEDIHYFIEMQENIGDRWNPEFAERMDIFEEFPFPVGYFFPSAGDLNNDGKLDFIVSANVDEIGNRTPTFLWNTGNTGSGQFLVTRFDSAGLNDFLPESFFVPELIDLDLDGDLDILMSGFDPAFAVEDGPDVPIYYYAKNIGTASDPEFLGWFDNPYGLMPNPFGEFLTGGDIDNDGDMDLLGTNMVIPPDSINQFFIHLNNPGANSKPAFTITLKSPFGLPTSFGEAQYLFPELVDINGDGDVDLFVFAGIPGGQTLQYFENSICQPETNDVAVSLCEGDAVKVGGNTYTEEGNYSIHLSGSDGCDSIVNLTINVVLPTTIFLNESICEGESFVVGDETFTASGDYTVYVVASNGCDSIINLTLVVIHLDIAVTVNENILTSNQTFASYQWFDCNTGEDIAGATGQSFVATSTGNYAVRIIDGNGCTALSACNAVVISSTTKPELANQISIFPNPADDLLHVLNISPYPVSGLSVINQYGQKLYENSEAGIATVDVSRFESGMYYLKLDFNGSVIMKKFIIN